MSKSNKRPYEQVKGMAAQLVTRFAPYCERVELAGSLRRQAPLIGDIELVALPRIEQTSLLAGEHVVYTNRLADYLDTLLLGGHIEKRLNKIGNAIAWGERYRAFQFVSKNGEPFAVDVFMCDEETWANTFIVRTGSREFSAWLVRQQSAGGACPSGMQFKEARLWRNGHMLNTPDEETIFTELGLPYIAPERRDNNLWLIDLRTSR